LKRSPHKNQNKNKKIKMNGDMRSVPDGKNTVASTQITITTNGKEYKV